MLLWPAMTLLGFLVLTAVVIALGAQTTARYEREQRAERPSGTRHAAVEPVSATAAA
jgi:membrane protein implicated in regulation of membrane protease activity